MNLETQKKELCHTKMLGRISISYNKEKGYTY